LAAGEATLRGGARLLAASQWLFFVFFLRGCARDSCSHPCAPLQKERKEKYAWTPDRFLGPESTPVGAQSLQGPESDPRSAVTLRRGTSRTHFLSSFFHLLTVHTLVHWSVNKERKEFREAEKEMWVASLL
jgi:hypothetical protein